MEKNKISDFLTPDISYLLGLITGRGEIQYSNDVKKIVIDFEYKTLESKSITKSFDQKLHIQTSLDPVVLRLQNIGINTQKIVSDSKLSIILRWQQEDIAWLFIKYLINGTRFSYHDFLIPDAIFETTESNKKEFLRGIADTTGYVRESNNLQYDTSKPKQYRVYLEINNKNWLLPPQICKLSQSIGIPIQNINYGHPNMRDPQAKSTSTSWAKEHQIKIFAVDFEKIGFYISHKNEALKELADYNKSHHLNKQKLCDGTSNRDKKKAIHPHETHEKLPESLAGKHFDGFRDICACLNCYLK